MLIDEHEVVIAGGGPTGLMLAGELALAGVDVAIVEQRLDQSVEGSRAGGLNSRSLELLDQRGIAERFVSSGVKHGIVPFAGEMLDATDLPSRHNYTLALWQADIERLLADWTYGLPVRAYRGRRLASFAQDGSGVGIELDDGTRLRAQYLAGCDGGRSLVRKAAGIAFEGWEPSLSYLVFEADLAEEPELGVRYGERGIHALGRLDDGKRFRGVLTEQHLERGAAPTAEELSAALVDAYGSDFGVGTIAWISRFTDAARQAATYRLGRVLLAGDAAHVHSPVGGQGLNTGLQDAVNLGWKLAQVAKGISPDSLLDSYHEERHPAGAALLKNTLALTALGRGDERSTALRELLVRTMQLDEPRRWYTAMLAGLDTRYGMGDGHPLLGRRMPDLELVTADGPRRLFTLLHDASPVLLNLGKPGSLEASGLPDHLNLVDANHEGALMLPIVGEARAPEAILIRPDGHVAWVGEGGTAGLADAIATWFGGTPQCG